MTNKNSSLGRGLGALIAKGSTKATDSLKKTKVESKKPAKASKAPVNKASVPVKKSTMPVKKAKVTLSVPVASSTPAPEKQENTSPYREVLISLIDANPYQPRMEFGEEELKELSASIASEGLMQPIVVRQKGERYELIAGERRLRATQMLKLNSIAVRIIKASDASSAVLSLIENLQRENLNPIDESMGYASLMRDFDLTQEEVSQRVGKARTTVANALRLLQLEQEIQGYIGKSMISMGHAKVLLGLDNSTQRMLLARRIIEERLSVRQAEEIVQQSKRGKATGLTQLPVSTTQTAVIRDLQKQLSSHLNSKVVLQHGPTKGKLVINYQGNEDLYRLLEKIGFAKAVATTNAA